MLKKYFTILSNPLLYYIDKSDRSVFRNFCLFNNTANIYNRKFEMKDVGRTLEYRFSLNRQLRFIAVLSLLILYFIFIHIKFSIFALIFFEILWLAINFGARAYYSSLYSEHLTNKFGTYELTDFEPELPQYKTDEFLAAFRSKIIVFLILIMLFFLPSIALRNIIKMSANSGKNYSQTISLANLYFSIYPKNERVYDMRTLAKVAQRDYEGALSDCTNAITVSGKRFTKRDITRFENLLYLQKKVSTPTDAIDLFNEYLTKKKLSILEITQMLWIKSIFKIENSILEGIVSEYDELIDSLDEKDTKNQFYMSCDKAYMLYIMKEYASAISVYNVLITFAEANKSAYSKELQSLYAERGFAKKKMGDIQGADADFMLSKINPWEMSQYEPKYSSQGFVVEKF